MNQYWQDVAGTIPAVAGDAVARVDNPLFPRRALVLDRAATHAEVVAAESYMAHQVGMIQPDPAHMPVLREVQRDE